MKTTIEIPDALFRKAKSTAALRGQSLRELITRAVSREIAEPAPEAAELSVDETMKEWDRLAKQNSEAWKTTKSALEDLSDMRNARGG